MAEIGEKRRYEPDPEYSYSADEFSAARARQTGARDSSAQTNTHYKLVWQSPSP